MIQSFRGRTPQIHPSAWVHPAATLIGEVVLGPRVTVWPGAVLRGDMGLIRVDADSNIQDGAIAHVTDGVSQTLIGPRVTVGHGVILHGCVVEGDAIIGMGAILLDNCVIPRRSIVGAGALVTSNKRFEPGGLLLGSPARRARELREKDDEWIHYSWTHYQETAVHYPGHPLGVSEER